MSIDRIVMGVAGILILSGTLLGMLVSHNFLYLSLFVGFMLFQASITKFCPMAWIIKKMGGQSKNFF